MRNRIMRSISATVILLLTSTALLAMGSPLSSARQLQNTNPNGSTVKNINGQFKETREVDVKKICFDQPQHKQSDTQNQPSSTSTDQQLKTTITLDENLQVLGVKYCTLAEQVDSFQIGIINTVDVSGTVPPPEQIPECSTQRVPPGVFISQLVFWHDDSVIKGFFMRYSNTQYFYGGKINDGVKVIYDFTPEKPINTILQGETFVANEQGFMVVTAHVCQNWARTTRDSTFDGLWMFLGLILAGGVIGASCYLTVKSLQKFRQDNKFSVNVSNKLKTTHSQNRYKLQAEALDEQYESSRPIVVGDDSRHNLFVNTDRISNQNVGQYLPQDIESACIREDKEQNDSEFDMRLSQALSKKKSFMIKELLASDQAQSQDNMSSSNQSEQETVPEVKLADSMRRVSSGLSGFFKSKIKLGMSQELSQVPAEKGESEGDEEMQCNAPVNLLDNTEAQNIQNTENKVNDAVKKMSSGLGFLFKGKISKQMSESQKSQAPAEVSKQESVQKQDSVFSIFKQASKSSPEPKVEQKKSTTSSAFGWFTKYADSVESQVLNCPAESDPLQIDEDYMEPDSVVDKFKIHENLVNMLQSKLGKLKADSALAKALQLRIKEAQIEVERAKNPTLETVSAKSMQDSDRLNKEKSVIQVDMAGTIFADESKFEEEKISMTASQKAFAARETINASESCIDIDNAENEFFQPHWKNIDEKEENLKQLQRDRMEMEDKIDDIQYGKVVIGEMYEKEAVKEEGLLSDLTSERCDLESQEARLRAEINKQKAFEKFIAREQKSRNLAEDVSNSVLQHLLREKFNQEYNDLLEKKLFERASEEITKKLINEYITYFIETRLFGDALAEDAITAIIRIMTDEAVPLADEQVTEKALKLKQQKYRRQKAWYEFKKEKVKINMHKDDLTKVPRLIEKMTGKDVLGDYMHFFEPKEPRHPDFKHYDGGLEKKSILMRNPQALAEINQASQMSPTGGSMSKLTRIDTACKSQRINSVDGRLTNMSPTNYLFKGYLSPKKSQQDNNNINNEHQQQQYDVENRRYKGFISQQRSRVGDYDDNKLATGAAAGQPIEESVMRNRIMTPEEQRVKSIYGKPASSGQSNGDFGRSTVKTQAMTNRGGSAMSDKDSKNITSASNIHKGLPNIYKAVNKKRQSSVNKSAMGIHTQPAGWFQQNNDYQTTNNFMESPRFNQPMSRGMFSVGDQERQHDSTPISVGLLVNNIPTINEQKVKDNNMSFTDQALRRSVDRQANRLKNLQKLTLQAGITQKPRSQSRHN